MKASDVKTEQLTDICVDVIYATNGQSLWSVRAVGEDHAVEFVSAEDPGKSPHWQVQEPYTLGSFLAKFGAMASVEVKSLSGTEKPVGN